MGLYLQCEYRQMHANPLSAKEYKKKEQQFKASDTKTQHIDFTSWRLTVLTKHFHFSNPMIQTRLRKALLPFDTQQKHHNSKALFRSLFE